MRVCVVPDVEYARTDQPADSEDKTELDGRGATLLSTDGTQKHFGLIRDCNVFVHVGFLVVEGH